MFIFIIMLIFILISPHSEAVPIARQVQLTTEIDKNKFAAGEFLDVRFVPEILTVVFDKNIRTFTNVKTNMSVLTSVSDQDANNGFSILMTDNTLVCVNSLNQVTTLVSSLDSDTFGFAKISIDGSEIPINDRISISKFNIKNNALWEGYYPVDISFLEMANTNLSEGSCSGNISVRVEFNI